MSYISWMSSSHPPHNLRPPCSCKMEGWCLKLIWGQCHFLSGLSVNGQITALEACPVSFLSGCRKTTSSPGEWESNVGCVEKARSRSKAEPAVYCGPNRMWSMSATEPLPPRPPPLWSILIKWVFVFSSKRSGRELNFPASPRGGRLQQQKKMCFPWVLGNWSDTISKELRVRFQWLPECQVISQSDEWFSPKCGRTCRSALELKYLTPTCSWCRHIKMCLMTQLR